MDALDRLEPVARSLLRQVDTALFGLGAPAEHRIWPLLRQVNTTPAAAVGFFVASHPGGFRTLGRELRTHARAYRTADFPAVDDWRGAAGEAYDAQAVALLAHLRGPKNGSHAAPAGETMADRLEATSSFVEGIADWYDAARARLATALAEILTSAEVVTVRSCPALVDGLADVARLPSNVPLVAATAAADIGARVLDVAIDALEAGRELGASGPLAELIYRPPGGVDPHRVDATIHLWR